MTKKEAFEMFEDFVKKHPTKFKYKFTPGELRTIEIFFINIRLKEGRTKGLSYKQIVNEVHDEYIKEYNEKNNIESLPEQQTKPAIKRGRPKKKK